MFIDLQLKTELISSHIMAYIVLLYIICLPDTNELMCRYDNSWQLNTFVIQRLG